MPTPIWLTDEDSEVAGYKRAKVPFNQTQPNRSDCPSLVRAVTVGAVAAIQRVIGGVTYSSGWLTDPLNGPLLTGSYWQLHAWAMQSILGGHIGLRFDISAWSPTGVTTPIVSATMASALGLVTQDVALTSGVATPTQLSTGDRLLIQVSMAAVGGSITGSSTFSYNGLFSRAEGDTFITCPDNIGLVGGQNGQFGDIPDDDILAIRTVLRDFSSETGLSSSPQMDDPEIVRYIWQAIETYSVDRPFTTAYYYTGDNNSFDFPLPPKYIWGFSRVVSIEYPASQQIPASLEYLDWEVRDQVLGMQPVRYLHMRTVIPDTTANNMFVVYTTRHAYSSEYSTIPKEDMDAILWLAASYCATAVATKFASSSDSTLDADVVNYQTLQSKWRSVSKDLRELYIKRVVEPDAATPVGSLQEWRPMLGTGQQFLWHSRRVRRVLY